MLLSCLFEIAPSCQPFFLLIFCIQNNKKMGIPGITNDLEDLRWLFEDEASNRPSWVYPTGTHYYVRFEASDSQWTCKIVGWKNKTYTKKTFTKKTLLKKNTQCQQPYCTMKDEEAPRVRICERSCKPHPTLKSRGGFPKHHYKDSRVCIPCSAKLK